MAGLVVGILVGRVQAEYLVGWVVVAEEGIENVGDAIMGLIHKLSAIIYYEYNI